MAVMSELPSRLRAKVARAMVVPLMADCHILMELPEDLQVCVRVGGEGEGDVHARQGGRQPSREVA